MKALQSRIIEGLNPPQREAVETLQGPLLILAGAGSGKTRVVTRRIANLIATGVKPWEILAITFTNKAAEEMRRRVEELVGQSGAWLSTFHSFCARVLRREAEVLGYHRDFTICDEDDAMEVLKDIVKRLGLSEDKRYSARNLRQQISAFKNQGLLANDLDEGMYHERVLKQVFKEYEAELRKTQSFDFDDLLRMTVVLFRDHPEVLQRYQDRFKYVLVDEYQDTNACQYHLIKQLGQKHRNVCATGDPDQSIYGWRGADVRNILSFEKDFPEAKIVKLEQNYRSTKRILSAADAVIANNVERKKKTLWTENAEGDKISFVCVGDDQLEGYEVAKQIERFVRDGRRCSDIAVFYRTNAQSRSLETALIQSNLPYQLIGGTAFYERREVKDALAYLRLLVNPKDDLAFRRVINVPKRALGPSALEQIEQYAAKTGKALMETLEGPDADDFLDTFKPKPRQGLLQFAKLFDQLRAMPTYPVADVLDRLLEKSGLRAALIEAGELERIDNVNELLNAAAEYDKENDPAALQMPSGPPPEPGAYDGLEELVQRQASVAGFLENSALLAPTDNFNPDDDRVTLMTLHMAKGLEFPIVFLTGMEEGLLPMLRATSAFGEFSDGGEDSAAVEEERRLVYVGITRARERLFISRAQFRRRFGKADVTQPSRFLEEIPEKLLEVEDRSQPAWAQINSGFAQPKVFKNRSSDDSSFEAFEREVSAVFGDEQPAPERARKSSSRRNDPALQTVVDRLLDYTDAQIPQEDTGALEIGDRVKHEDFGDGIIENISGAGLSTKVKVHFRQHGPKLLLLSIATAKMRKV